MKKHRIKTMALALLVIASAAALLWRPQAVASGVSRGLAVCGQTLVPSLFPFLVLGGFAARSGLAAAAGRRLETATRRLFGLSGVCATGILLSMTGGYPTGGAVVGELVKSGQIPREEGRRMLRFCVNGGPGFIIGTVGAGLMGSVPLGVLLFACNAASSLLIGVASAPRHSRKRRVTQHCVTLSQPPVAALTSAVTAAMESLFSMCGFVLLFSAVVAFFDSMGLERRLSLLLSCVLEVSGGCAAAAALQDNAVFFLGFAVGFGGLSVHCQLAGALRGMGLVDARFFAARVLQGVLTAVSATVLFRYIPVSLPVGGVLDTPVVQAGYGSATVSVMLLVLGGIWMLTVGGERCLDKDT